MKYLLAILVLTVVVACSGATEETAQEVNSENAAGNAVETIDLDEIDKELDEIESELNLDEELESLEVSLE